MHFHLHGVILTIFVKKNEKFSKFFLTGKYMLSGHNYQ